MRLNCLTHGHLYQKTRTSWVNNIQDEYYATNTGGVIKSYEVKIYRCIKCLKEKTVYTGRKKFI